MKFKGRVIEKLEVREFGNDDKPFKVQTVIIEEEGEMEFPNTLAIDFSNDKLSFSGSVEVGQLVEALYSTSVSENDGKYYNRIRGYKLRQLETKYEQNAYKEDEPF